MPKRSDSPSSENKIEAPKDKRRRVGDLDSSSKSATEILTTSKSPVSLSAKSPAVAEVATTAASKSPTGVLVQSSEKISTASSPATAVSTSCSQIVAAGFSASPSAEDSLAQNERILTAFKELSNLVKSFVAQRASTIVCEEAAEHVDPSRRTRRTRGRRQLNSGRTSPTYGGDLGGDVCSTGSSDQLLSKRNNPVSMTERLGPLPSLTDVMDKLTTTVREMHTFVAAGMSELSLGGKQPLLLSLLDLSAQIEKIRGFFETPQMRRVANRACLSGFSDESDTAVETSPTESQTSTFQGILDVFVRFNSTVDEIRQCAVNMHNQPLLSSLSEMSNQGILIERIFRDRNLAKHADAVLGLSGISEDFSVDSVRGSKVGIESIYQKCLASDGRGSRGYLHPGGYLIISSRLRGRPIFNIGELDRYRKYVERELDALFGQRTKTCAYVSRGLSAGQINQEKEFEVFYFVGKSEIPEFNDPFVLRRISAFLRLKTQMMNLQASPTRDPIQEKILKERLELMRGEFRHLLSGNDFSQSSTSVLPQDLPEGLSADSDRELIVTAECPSACCSSSSGLGATITQVGLFAGRSSEEVAPDDEGPLLKRRGIPKKCDDDRLPSDQDDPTHSQGKGATP